MASINEHKSASVHGNFCPRRLSWKAVCSCGAEHNPACPGLPEYKGICDCGVDAPRDVSKYGVSQPLGVMTPVSADSGNVAPIREDGFYWVLPHQAEEWEPASWSEDEGWMLLGMDSALNIPAIVKVGERIIERASLEECVHCCEPCRDLYQVKDSVWCDEAGWSKSDVAHIRCLEEKIGRSLTGSDFIDDPINDAVLYLVNERNEAIEQFEKARLA